MSEQMNLISFLETGHVLAVVTCTSDPKTPPKIEDIVGDGLPVRDYKSGETQLIIEAPHLKVSSVELVKDLLVAPQHYALVNNLPVLQLPSTGGTIDITLSTTSVKVTFANTVPTDTEIWAQVEGGSNNDRFTLLVGKRASTGPAEVTKNLQLQPGDYFAMALVPGYNPIIKKQTVT